MIREIFELLTENKYDSLFIIFIIFTSIIIDISPIELSPWKWVGSKIKKCVRGVGKILNGDLDSRVDDIFTQIHDIEYAQLLSRKKTLRRAILRFADECRLKTKHSKEMFDVTLDDIDEYLEICKKTSDPNHVISEAIKFIEQTYHRCMVDNDFL